MIHWLINIGLIVTPFVLAPNHSDIAREPKLAFACVFALFIGLYGLYKGKISSLSNKWAYALVGYVLISFYLSPKPELKLFGIDSGRFWSWEGLFYSVVFLVFAHVIASFKWTDKRFNQTVDVMIWSGFAMGCLVTLQSFHLDQFFEHRFGTYGHMAGTLGNPTLVGPFLVMLIPLAYYRKKFINCTIMSYALIATRSDVALVGFIAMICTWLAMKGKKWFIGTGTVVITTIVIICSLYFTNEEFRKACPDNERFLTWGQAINDVSTPIMQNSKKTYIFTGIGIGSFKYLFHVKNNQRNDNFIYAHNDYIQIIYELGIVGIILFMGMVLHGLRQIVTVKAICEGITGKKQALLSGFVGILVCGAGIFIFQIGTHIFYSLVIFGMMHNKYILGETNA